MNAINAAKTVSQPPVTRHKLDDREIALIEICLSMLATINAFTLQCAFDFSQMVAVSGTDEGYERWGVVQPFSKDGKVRSMNNRLTKLIRQHEKSILSLCRGDNRDAFAEKLSNSMDATEELLHETTDAYMRLLYQRIADSGNKTPQDPVLLSSLLRCIIFCDICSNVYLHISSEANFPDVGKVKSYRFMKMDIIYEQITKMLTYMDFLDTDGKILEYDLKGLMFSKDSMDISTDIMHILYSCEYLDAMIEARGGENPHLGSNKFKSLVPTFDDSTLSIEEYNEKYRNMYK